MEIFVLRDGKRERKNEDGGEDSMGEGRRE